MLVVFSSMLSTFELNHQSEKLEDGKAVSY
jgi:hypothetical protein